MAENIIIIELSKFGEIALETRFKNLISILFIQFFIIILLNIKIFIY